MNAQHIRDRLGEFVKAKAIDQRMAEQAKTAPLFLQTRSQPITDNEIEWCKTNLMHDKLQLPTKLPYPVFIVHHESKDKKSDTSTTYCWQFSDALVMVMAIPDTREEGDASNEYWLRTVFNYQDNPENAGLMTGYWKGKPIDHNRNISKDAIDTLANTPRFHVVTLCFDVMCPANTVLRVEPNKPTKSVEWRQSRTHYLILTRKQAEACQRDARGPTDHEISRAAHWRRAHLRRLASVRYTHKRGQLVFVKQAWVGPTEWQGTDGKIYKVQPTPQTP